MPAGTAHDVGDQPDLEQIQVLLQHADDSAGASELIDSMAQQLRLLAERPSVDEVERTDVQRLLELHRDLVTMWRVLCRELGEGAAGFAAAGKKVYSQKRVDRLNEVGVATAKLTASLLALQASADRTYGAATPDELDRMFVSEVLRIAPRIPTEVWQQMCDRRAGR